MRWQRPHSFQTIYMGGYKISEGGGGVPVNSMSRGLLFSLVEVQLEVASVIVRRIHVCTTEKGVTTTSLLLLHLHI